MDLAWIFGFSNHPTPPSPYREEYVNFGLMLRFSERFFPERRDSLSVNPQSRNDIFVLLSEIELNVSFSFRPIGLHCSHVFVHLFASGSLLTLCASFRQRANVCCRKPQKEQPKLASKTQEINSECPLWRPFTIGFLRFRDDILELLTVWGVLALRQKRGKNGNAHAKLHHLDSAGSALLTWARSSDKKNPLEPKLVNPI